MSEDGTTPTDATAPTPPTATEATEAAGGKGGRPTGPSEETKAKFREALARKQGQSAREGESAAGGKLHETHGHGPASAQRMFRRKAGG